MSERWWLERLLDREVILWRGTSAESRGSVRLIDGEIAAFNSEKGGRR
jgi:hypothetical protein